MARKAGCMLIALFLTLAVVECASACSVCQGDPDSKMVKAAQSGVVVMIFVTYSVLMLFGTLAAVCFARYRRLVRTGQTAPATARPPVDHADE